MVARCRRAFGDASAELEALADAARRGSAEGAKQVVPELSEHLTTHAQQLAEAVARLRVASAQALREEGATITDVANWLGVSRQRMSVLLRRER